MKVCRVIRDFPSLKSKVCVPDLNACRRKVEYADYGLAPGVYTLMKEQVKLGTYMKVIAAMGGKARELEIEEGLEVHRAGKPYGIMAFAKILEIDKASGIDIIHAHATSSVTYALLRRLLKKKPYVVHVHGTTAGVKRAMGKSQSFPYRRVASLRRKFRNWVSLERQQFMWKKADSLIAVSNNIRAELSDLYGISPEKIHTVHNGVDVNFFKPSVALARRETRQRLGIRGDPMLLCVGHLSPRKGIEYLLKSIPKVTKKFPRAVFVLVGGTPKFVGKTDFSNLWMKFSARLGIQENIVFAGEVKHEDILTFYKAADFFVFPTLYEGLAKALLEAMACGLPIVATNAGGNSDVIVHEENGILVEPSNSDELADALIRVISDEPLAMEIGRKARATVEKNFTWKNAAIKIMRVYEELSRQ